MKLSDLPKPLQDQIKAQDAARGVKRPGRGRGVVRKAGEMNKTEAAYAEYLDDCIPNGRVKAYWFDAIKLRLAGNTFYTPDFFVLMADWSLEVHEVKGHWEDDARVKIKVAADKYPFRFLAVRRDKGGWAFEEI